MPTVDRVDVREYDGRIEVTTGQGFEYRISSSAESGGNITVSSSYAGAARQVVLTRRSAYPPAQPDPVIVRGECMVFVAEDGTRMTTQPVKTIELAS